jgi:hypothetical protein
MKIVLFAVLALLIAGGSAATAQNRQSDQNQYQNTQNNQGRDQGRSNVNGRSGNGATKVNANQGRHRHQVCTTRHGHRSCSWSYR